VAQPVRTALIRVAQELVTNSTRHANSSVLRLSLRHTETDWILRGADDGVGTDRVCAGYGLSGIRERVEGLGGRLTIETSSGHGFAVTVAIPKTAAA
jgi:two-component system sensor histidine kinase ComP